MAKDDSRLTWDAVILGGGAAGLMCAITAAQRVQRDSGSKLKVAVLESQERVGKKILISGGGRCNFTNLHAKPENYLSQRPDFCRSALARFQPRQFIDWVEARGIPYHEKKLGQLFCDGSSREIVEMLVDAATDAGVELVTGCTIQDVISSSDSSSGESGRFIVKTTQGDWSARSVVVATGGLSFPKLGATGIGHSIARKFNLALTEIHPGLVPLVLSKGEAWTDLSGVSLPVRLSVGERSFEENLLFTHRGISGPAVLQISSYWEKGKPLEANLLPDFETAAITGGQSLEQFLGGHLPQRFLKVLAEQAGKMDPALLIAFRKPWVQVSKEARQAWSRHLERWKWEVQGTEGYAKAEVTVGGVDTGELSSKTMEARRVPGLYFIGEVVDVTGWLGGYNFQWAWASGHAAGIALASS